MSMTMAARQARSLAHSLRLSSSNTQPVSSRGSQLVQNRGFSAECVCIFLVFGLNVEPGPFTKASYVTDKYLGALYLLFLTTICLLVNALHQTSRVWSNIPGIDRMHMPSETCGFDPLGVIGCIQAIT
eukprot:Gb_14345 [translate_table: standard]